MRLTDDVDQSLLLAAYGKALFVVDRCSERIRELEKLVDHLRLDFHHLEIHCQGLNDENGNLRDRMRALMEKAERVKIPTVPAPAPPAEIPPPPDAVIYPFQEGADN